MSLIPRPSSPQQQSTSIVLDALPYVEQPQPHYEQHAISLIEAELSSAPQQQAEHPSLAGRLLPSHPLKDAPLASAAYAHVAKRREAGDDSAQTVDWSHGSQGGGIEDELKSAKIQYEHHRLHLANLDLHSNLCTAQHYQRYHSQLESLYTAPQSKMLQEQRLKVDGINATRMEEQTVAMQQLNLLRGKYIGLMDKNCRLDGAIDRLEEEVQLLKGELGHVADESMEGGVDSREH